MGHQTDDTPVTNDEKRREFLSVMEERRRDADRFAWAIPAVVVASQAFLLTIALDGDASAQRRLITAGAAFVLLLGAVHQFWKQAFHFALYEAVIKRERDAMKWPLVDRDSLLVGADTLEARFQREWMERDADGKLVPSTDHDDHHFLPRRTIQWRAVRVWLGLFGLIAVLDLLLAGWAVYDWDPFGWWLDDTSDGFFDRFFDD
jgi:hypothetical protein